MSRRIIDAHDVALFDLDGVVYLGPVAVAGAVEGIAGIGAAGARVLFVTNNAARSPEAVAEHLRELGFSAGPDDLITSAQVAVGILANTLPAGTLILVAGTDNLVRLVRDAGFEVTASADDDPVAVLQGYDPNMTWPRLDEAAIAVQRGATWFATNDDATRPTDRGLVPGLGAALGVVGTTVRQRPTVFGKPHPPMLDYAMAATAATRPIFVGDRIDTDIVGANRADMASLMVFTGAHGKHELVAAGPGERPTHIGADLRALLDPPRVATAHQESWRCRDAAASTVDGRAELSGPLDTEEQQLDALWAVVHLVWGQPDVDTSDALSRLTRLP